MALSDYQENIEHEGIVHHADNKSVIVRIISASACSGCHAEGVCSISGKEEKDIEVKGFYNVKKGDSVIVTMQKSLGHFAVILGYVVPFILIITILGILSRTAHSELLSGLVSIGSLAPYYLILWLFRNKLDARFRFTLKINR